MKFRIENYFTAVSFCFNKEQMFEKLFTNLCNFGIITINHLFIKGNT